MRIGRIVPPSNRWPVLWAAKLFPPELFADVDMPAEVKAFYRRFFGHELTDTQVARS